MKSSASPVAVTAPRRLVDGRERVTLNTAYVRALESAGLVELVEERRKGNCNERVLQATAASYVISPSALSAVAPDPS